jgi:phosphoribosylformylglycinamidine synthase
VKYGVVRFPGTCDDADALLACGKLGEAEILWHADHDLKGVDAVLIPGGFSYGDHLRVGAVARFSPVMTEVGRFARDGGPVIGVCNGFQILCEAGLLPGALLPNTSLRFDMRQTTVEVLESVCRWTRGLQPGEQLSIPAKNTTGRYYAPDETLAGMRERGQIVLRYLEDPLPNGSVEEIAGVCNEAGNVFGLMPHPEHAADLLTGSADGLRVLAA